MKVTPSRALDRNVGSLCCDFFMAKRDGWDRRSARRHLSAAQDAGPPSDCCSHFDPDREAIVLMAGDKAGRWIAWYAEAILLAEKRYAAYRREANEEEQ
jgi:hypothetical protein